MIIKPINAISVADLQSVITGYTTNEQYRVTVDEADDLTTIALMLIQLKTPFAKRYDLEDQAYYDEILQAGLSLAAYDDDRLIGIALADMQAWNNAFWLHEFHVHEAYRGHNIGRQLMNALIAKAREAHARLIVCETQNTNVPAIRFYRKMGFTLDAVDTSLYAELDEVAVYMKYHFTS